MTRTATLSGNASLTSPEHRLITVIGAGGKTSLISWLGMRKQPQERRIITTTTKILPLPDVCTILQDDGPNFPGRVNKALEKHATIVVARRLDPASGKLIGLSTYAIAMLDELGLAQRILVEGDGAARKPLKAPASHEPVVPHTSNLCIGVMGLDAVNSLLRPENVHRPEHFPAVTGLEYGERITPAHMVRLALSPAGLFKSCPPHSHRAVFLNKSDIPDGDRLIEEFESTLHSIPQAHTLRWFAGSVRQNRFERIGLATIEAPLIQNNRLEISHQFCK